MGGEQDTHPVTPTAGRGLHFVPRAGRQLHILRLRPGYGVAPATAHRDAADVTLSEAWSGRRVCGLAFDWALLRQIAARVGVAHNIAQLPRLRVDLLEPRFIGRLIALHEQPPVQSAA